MSGPGPILVVNPNSNPAVTAGLDAALAPLRRGGAPAIECVTSAGGPFGVQSDADAVAAVPPMLELVAGRPDAAAVVIACFSDPGIGFVREAAGVPVFGIQESGVLTALCRGRRVGIIAIAEASIPRHTAYLGTLGLLDRIAGERALNMTVDESARAEGVLERITDIGRQLIADGADALVLGCAGMARHRAPAEAALGRPVIEPAQAAVAMALGTVTPGL
ncbi:aspartate/glutamate racemase family protein [Paralimibaculum aggregatum]|uniref:Aspartate/glutamate racemase family protein n=1 Tax=Paralimibaculum aggregatum TaxID=3036245 RepID=A0ABQ6LIU0_9RHOB|nr:aspartate/glutamate racemase family protein [Limibaculum sp. NKW23]GMG81577.1 aspartate/glutamate racemase family protein [Limibaculum sp. NKW23]